MSRAKGILYKHRIEFAVLAVFFVLIGGFAIANPKVFLNYRAYIAVFTTLGASIILVTSSVFVVASGEIGPFLPLDHRVVGHGICHDREGRGQSRFSPLSPRCSREPSAGS